MNQALIDQLSQESAEEKALRKGQPLLRDTYTDEASFLIHSDTLLPPNRMITLRQHTRYTAFPTHSHDYVEMLYMLHGETVHDLPGGETLTLRAGELLLMGCGTMHAIRYSGKEDIGVNIIVQPTFFDDALTAIGTDNVMGHFLVDAMRRSGGSVPYLHFRVADMQAVQSLMESLLTSLLQPTPVRQRILKSYMTLLLLLLTDQAVKPVVSSSGASPMVMDVLEEIQEHYAGLELKTIAARHHVSPSYLSQAVQRATGESCTVLLQRRRIDQAKRLLRTTNLTIVEVCSAVGYSNTRHFYQLFEEQVGMPPRAYRKMMQHNS